MRNSRAHTARRLALPTAAAALLLTGCAVPGGGSTALSGTAVTPR
ncbi:hypothetical protein ACIHEJ_15385 [Streptomyces sp. NPDC052301]